MYDEVSEYYNNLLVELSFELSMAESKLEWDQSLGCIEPSTYLWYEDVSKRLQKTYQEFEGIRSEA